MMQNDDWDTVFTSVFCRDQAGGESLEIPVKSSPRSGCVNRVAIPSSALRSLSASPVGLEIRWNHGENRPFRAVFLFF